MANVQTKNTMAIGRRLPYRGKLTAMPSTSLVLQDDDKNLWGSANKKGLSIEFPAMPDTIELARSAEYLVAPNPMLPDGYHQYMNTKPLEIPVSFRLHSFDQTYCTQGALTLLQIAARLHAFVLPITNDRAIAQAALVGKNGQQTDDQTSHNAATGDVVFSSYGAKSGQANKIYPPVTCWLHLIWTDEGLPGISCVGYVKDVRVVLHGPFLKGPGESFNLPSAGEFSFTFVHRPGHNNAFGSSQSDTKPKVGAQSSAFATDVRDNFYNTRHLVYMANYKGLDDGVPEDKATQTQTQANATPAQPILSTSTGLLSVPTPFFNVPQVTTPVTPNKTNVPLTLPPGVLR